MVNLFQRHGRRISRPLQTKFWDSLVTGTSASAPGKWPCNAIPALQTQSRYRHMFSVSLECACNEYLLYRLEAKSLIGHSVWTSARRCGGARNCKKCHINGVTIGPVSDTRVTGGHPCLMNPHAKLLFDVETTMPATFPFFNYLAV